MKVTILDDWFDTLQGLPCFEKLSTHEVNIHRDHVKETTALVERLAKTNCVVLIRERTKITGELLDNLPNLRLISQRSVYPHIDVSACTRNGILLCSNMHSETPSYATAELTLGLILASARQIPAQMSSLQEGNWQMGVGQSLRGRTLGLYGYGRIAKTLAEYASAIGMNLQWWASETGRARAKEDGATVSESRQSFFATSDFVSVHVRLKPETRGIIAAEDLAQMKPSATFKNTSRSGLIASGVLEAAITAGRPGYAAVDVYDQDPLTNKSHFLLNHPCVIATPHIGYVTVDEFELQFSDIFDQINAYEIGKPINMINPEVLKINQTKF